jgi:propanol-preferring alcohol dehydrogenase
VGDAVGVRWTAKKCLSCEECRKGHESSCANSKVRSHHPSLSVTYRPADTTHICFQCHGFTVDGCFAQFVVAWASHITPIPDGMSLVDAAPILCAGVVRRFFPIGPYQPAR